jgi:hypothetical protein
MAELDRETFVTLIKQAGLDFDDAHVDELLPDVRLMLGRVDMLFEARTEGLEPGLLPPRSDA